MTDEDRRAGALEGEAVFNPEYAYDYCNPSFHAQSYVKNLNINNVKLYLEYEGHVFVEGDEKENRENLESILYSKHIDVLREDIEKEASKKPNLNGWSAKTEKSWMSDKFESWSWCQNLCDEQVTLLLIEEKVKKEEWGPDSHSRLMCLTRHYIDSRKKQNRQFNLLEEQKKK